MESSNAPSFDMSVKCLWGNPFVNGSATIEFVIMCLMDTLFFGTSSLTTKYFNSIAPFEYFLFLEKKIIAELSQ